MKRSLYASKMEGRMISSMVGNCIRTDGFSIRSLDTARQGKYCVSYILLRPWCLGRRRRGPPPQCERLSPTKNVGLLFPPLIGPQSSHRPEHLTSHQAPREAVSGMWQLRTRRREHAIRPTSLSCQLNPTKTFGCLLAPHPQRTASDTALP
jgi:hypothetical protein